MALFQKASRSLSSESEPVPQPLVLRVAAGVTENRGLHLSEHESGPDHDQQGNGGDG